MEETRQRRRRKRSSTEAVAMQMGPMIDMVFLLLVFFMVTAKPIPQEADISLALPGAVAQDEAVALPDEQRIRIRKDGAVVLNELTLGSPDDGKLKKLIATLTRFRLAAEANKSEALVSLDPHDLVPHQRIVDVLNACAIAGIHGVSFTQGNTGGSEG